MKSSAQGLWSVGEVAGRFGVEHPHTWPFVHLKLARILALGQVFTVGPRFFTDHGSRNRSGQCLNHGAILPQIFVLTGRAVRQPARKARSRGSWLFVCGHPSLIAACGRSPTAPASMRERFATSCPAHGGRTCERLCGSRWRWALRSGLSARMKVIRNEGQKHRRRRSRHGVAD